MFNSIIERATLIQILFEFCGFEGTVFRIPSVSWMCPSV